MQTSGTNNKVVESRIRMCWLLGGGVSSNFLGLIRVQRTATKVRTPPYFLPATLLDPA